MVLRENADYLPEAFWSAHKIEFPRVYQFARHSVASCLLSPSERIWSAMKHFLTDAASHMEAEKAIQLMFLNQHQKEFDRSVRISAIEAGDDDELNALDDEMEHVVAVKI
jgi:hypothetical protein